MAWFDVKQTGDWPKVKTLMSEMPKRVEAQKVKIVRDFIKRFRRMVMGRIPNDSQMKVYRKSIKLRRLAGGTNKREHEFGYALIADPKAIEMDSLDQEKDVVYAQPTEESADAVGVLLIENSPWAGDVLDIRQLASVSGVEFVHRRVTKDEVAGIRKKNLAVIGDNMAEFKAAGVKPKDDQEPQAPKSMPDLAFSVLRMEFGYKARPNPHWGYASRQAMSIIRKQMKQNDSYTKYLNDTNFTQWRKPEKKLKPLPSERFMKRYLAFQKRVQK